MKAHLMFADRDLTLVSAYPCAVQTLIDDLSLERIFDAMAAGDETIREVCRSVLLTPLHDLSEISYRQDVMKDTLRFPDHVRTLYDICAQAEQKRLKSWNRLRSNHLSSTYSSAIEYLKLYTESLLRIRKIADRYTDEFSSAGFRNLFLLIRQELTDEYFEAVQSELNELSHPDGTLISAKFGSTLQGTDYVLRRKNDKNFRLHWMLAPSYKVAEDDNQGMEDLGRRRDRAINEPANALAQSAEHLVSFFDLMRCELAFFVGCLNLYDRLKDAGLPCAIPQLLSSETFSRSWENLYDVSLALIKGKDTVGNTECCTDKHLYIITGANQGGKSTFLRSMGQAQLMAQCGMFTGSASLTLPVRGLVYSHFKKEEDAELESGKLDEELFRMSGLADHLQTGDMILFNESFAATNEREGSEICRQITQALTENGIEVFSVTHLYQFAAAYLEDEQTQYLRAERLESGSRTFRIVPGTPTETAYGEDLYRKIFNTEGAL